MTKQNGLLQIACTLNASDKFSFTRRRLGEIQEAHGEGAAFEGKEAIEEFTAVCVNW